MDVDAEEYEARVEEALEEVREGIADAVGDYGSEAVEGGGWIEIVRNVARGHEEKVAREVLRREGLDWQGGRGAR
jgi:hypothetical protein